jgi:hypothetical protein
MRRILPHSLWLGHAGDVWALRDLLNAGIEALIDLALNEPLPLLTRELAYCRFPLIDGMGNSPWVLRAAVTTTANLLRAKVPTLVYCSAGMSRTLAIAAAALAFLTGQSPSNCLSELSRERPADVSPALWQEVVEAVGLTPESDPTSPCDTPSSAPPSSS